MNHLQRGCDNSGQSIAPKIFRTEDTNMHQFTKTLLAAAVFAVSGAAMADSHEKMTSSQIKADPALADSDALTRQGVLFVNGLNDNIVAGYSRPQEKCDVFLCDKWRRIGEGGGPISPGKGAIRMRFHKTGNASDVICKYDLKIATQPVDGSAEPMEHTFNDLDICMNGMTTRITFEEKGGKVHAIQTISDTEGNVTTVANIAD